MPTSRSALDIARELAGFGFNVLPARPGGKTPAMQWQKYQDQRTDPQLSQWFAGNRQWNYWVPCGRISGIVVLDCDNDAAEAYWRAELGDDLLDATTCVQTRKGHHYYFQLGDEAVTSWSRHDENGPSFDVRAEGTGVIVPPSVHETGFTYEWVRGPEAMQPLPDALRGGSGRTQGAGGVKPRSMLSQLLGNPPTGSDSGRNIWLSKIAGHYAKEYRDREDAYRIHCRMANDQLTPPLDEAEFTKTIESIWKAEQGKAGGAAAGLVATLASGWLAAGGDNNLLCMIKVRDSTGAMVTDWTEWSDFNIKAIGVVDDEDGERVYDVELRRQRQGDVRRVLLPSDVLVDLRLLNKWLGGHGVGIFQPDNVFPKGAGSAERLRRYVENQNPASFKVVHSLGWDGHGFITHEGVIRPDGLHGHEGVRPNPARRDWAPYRYGFAEEELARAVLREVLTFHDDTVTSVFGAWWAACLIKPQLIAATSMFPFMALEAPSESGKTSGFFSLMLQLNGNTAGNVNPTWASLRDYLSANHSGIVWIDDLNDPDRLMELLRQATGEGSVSKKGEDRTSTVTVQLVAPIVLSGEALNLGTQKALVDRAVMLDVPSPTNRRSLRDPNRPQWDDIVALRKRFNGDLTTIAGTMVVMALRGATKACAEVVSLMPSPGRWGEKMGILRAGGRLLAEMTGDPVHIERVDDWVARQDNPGAENTLTLKLLPAALRQYREPDAPSASANERWPQTPAFVRDGEVWFNTGALADWWYQYRNGRVELRTETGEALLQQTYALGLRGGGRTGGTRARGNKKRFRLTGGGESWYWRLPEEYTHSVLARARGAGLPGSPTGESQAAEGQPKLDLPVYWDILDAYQAGDDGEGL